MGTISEKLTYLNETKQELKEAINNLGGNIDNNTTFREYVEELEEVYDNLPKTSYGEGTNISLANTNKGKLDFDNLLYGDVEQDTTTGKNLLAPPQQFSHTNNGITATSDGKGAYTLKGTCTASGFIFTGEAVENYTIQDGDYLHLLNTGTSSNNGFVLRTDSGDITNTFNITNRIINLASHIGKTIKQVSFYCNNGSVLDISFTPMIVNSSSATTWEIYTGGIPSPNPNYPQDIQVVTGEQEVTISNADDTDTTSYTISLGNIELAKIGDYKDYIYKSGDKWYKHQVIGKKTYVGTETFNETVESGKHRFSDNTIASEIETSMLPYCNYFTTSLGTSNIWTDGYVSLPTSGNVSFYIASITTSSVWRSWLSEHNTILYYGLATSTDTEITDTTLIQQLNNLLNSYSKYGTTNIQVEGTLAGGLKVRALKGV